MSYTKDHVISSYNSTIDREAVVRMAGLDYREILRRVRAGTFPKPIQRGHWCAGAVYDWIYDQYSEYIDRQSGEECSKSQDNTSIEQHF